MGMTTKYLYKASLIRVVNGDTIDAWVDLGFDIAVRRRIRLWAIVAPDMRTEDLLENSEGAGARDRLQELIDIGEGKFLLRSVRINKCGQCLGEIYIQDININKQLLAEGLVGIRDI